MHHEWDSNGDICLYIYSLSRVTGKSIADWNKKCNLRPGIYNNNRKTVDVFVIVNSHNFPLGELSPTLKAILRGEKPLLGTKDLLSLQVIKHFSRFPLGLYCPLLILFCYSEDISVTSTVTQYLWLTKSDQNKRNDRKFVYFKRLSLHIYARFHPETWRKVRISG